ncbi:uncharacterized Zn finger protein (UPF0148 family) [Streptacidiphilus sp. MAP12-16]|uniref:SCO2400 family protein n=1 Tax=Streptacidiphilus sp. MAP12-16 TaxID=3156300 RepID=UPI003513B663
MNYCSTCRRHLNGALSCPGCGRAAEVLATPAENPPVEATQSAAAYGDPAADAAPGGGSRRQSARQSTRQFSRERERQRRRRRRVLTLAAAGLVSVGGLGALVLVSTPSPAAGSPAAAMQNTPTGSAGVSPSAGDPAATTPAFGATASHRPTAKASATASHSASAGASSASSRPSSSRTATDSSSPTGQGPATHSPSAPSSSPASPTPSASPSCKNHFLWWCSG